MTDTPSPDSRATSGTADDRKPQPVKKLAQESGGTGLVGFIVGMIHQIIKCRVDGQWVWHPMDDSLIEWGVFLSLPLIKAIIIIVTAPFLIAADKLSKIQEKEDPQ